MRLQDLELDRERGLQVPLLVVDGAHGPRLHSLAALVSQLAVESGGFLDHSSASSWYPIPR